MDAFGQNLQPLPYHNELKDYLKTEEPELWKWFASAQSQADYTEHLRLELLKATYRLDLENHPELYKAVEEAKAKLQLDIPVTLYQAQNASQLNAALYYIPGEGHVVFSGPVFSLLSAEEIKSVIGHELAHYHLWRVRDGEFLIADRLLQGIANDPRAAASHIQSARWYQLYTEIFCDRGSFCVTGNVEPVVASLVKMQTGLQQVSATSYLKQAGEIFQKASVKTGQLSHPEAFIRARAAALWAEGCEDAAAQISAMIQGTPMLDELDLVGQQRLTTQTRQLLEVFLQPKWFQTGAVLGHARLFFKDFLAARVKDAALFADLDLSDPKLRDYICYLLLDFVVADPDLDDMPMAAALEMARALKIDTHFEKYLTRELKIRARDLKRLKEQAAGMLAGEEAKA